MVQRTLRPIYVSVSFLSSKIEKALLRLQYNENVNAGLIDCMIMMMFMMFLLMIMVMTFSELEFVTPVTPGGSVKILPAV